MSRFETDREFNIYMLEINNVPDEVINYISTNHPYLLEEFWFGESLKDVDKNIRKDTRREETYVYDYNSSQLFQESIERLLSENTNDEGLQLISRAFDEQNLDRLTREFPDFKTFLMKEGY